MLMAVTRKGKMVMCDTTVTIWRVLMSRTWFSCLVRVLLVISLTAPTPAYSQAWSAILDPSRATDWTKAGILGGIPNYTTVCRTVVPSGLVQWQANTVYARNTRIADSNGNTETVTTAGQSGAAPPEWGRSDGATTHDNSISWSMNTGGTDTSNINAALSACSGRGQVVQLQAGTYVLTRGLLFNKDPGHFMQPLDHVVLRGAGPDKTKLVFTNAGPCNTGDICVTGNPASTGAYSGPGYTGGAAAWLGASAAGAYAKGYNTIIVGRWTGNAPTVGSMIFLDQRSDSIGICPQAATGTDTGGGACAGVDGATEKGTTVTITTSIPHGYSVGQCVGIGGVGGRGSTNAYNSVGNKTGSCATDGFLGWFPITAVPTATTFQYHAPTAGLAPSGGGFATIDTGGPYVSNVVGAVAIAGAHTGRYCPPKNVTPNPSCATGEISERAQMEPKIVTSVTAGGRGTCPAGDTCYQIDPPLVMPNWRTSQAPGVWWAGTPMAQYIGIENLTTDLTNDGAAISSGGSSRSGIKFNFSYNSWVKNVRVIHIGRNAVELLYSMHVSVVDNYFYGTKGSQATAYTVESQVGSGSNLVQNNICQHVVSCLMTAVTISSVFSYNYMIDSSYTAGGGPFTRTGFKAPMMSESHETSWYNLFEGNDSPGVNSDNLHGTSGMETSFRNRIVGQDYPIKAFSLAGVNSSAFSRAFNWVGNVIGTPGAQTVYQSTTPSENPVWAIGQQKAVPTVISSDTVAVKSLLRWGNYDVVTGASRWCGDSSSQEWSTICNGTSEIPSTGIAFINRNPVPSSKTLPASFYLAAEPSFWATPWGAPPWPAIGPDVSGGTAPDGVGGYSYAIPAQLCYANTPIDSSYQQTFTVTSASWSSGIVTLNIGSNGLAANETVTVSGVAPSAYNGKYQILSSTSTGISYTLRVNPGAYISGGTVTYPNILLFNAANCYPAVYRGLVPPSSLRVSVP